jgi:hypothetical protein
MQASAAAVIRHFENGRKIVLRYVHETVGDRAADELKRDSNGFRFRAKKMHVGPK